MAKLKFLDGDEWVEVKGVTVIGGPKVNVGTIAHVEFGKSTLQRAIRAGINSGRGNKSDRKRNRKDRWR
ncbi:hypothetical protein R7007_21730 [Vibrio sp. 1636]|uniref:Elongation factor Tu n=1 Tax=Vibrio alginolyticus TaxID=663 RepID=A0A7Y0MZG5_VIBAL|nr:MULTISPECIES: hypothetical protein [Vibrio]MDW2204293.1 hypothetical protein [Vibrio sp. 1636]NMR76228.1 hypothetical protein [Vibrio alginolyticus]